MPLNEKRVNEQQDKLDQLIREEKTLIARLSETKSKFSEAKSALNAASTRSFFKVFVLCTFYDLNKEK